MASRIRWLASAASAVALASGCRSAPPSHPSVGEPTCPSAGSGAIQGIIQGRDGRRLHGAVVLAHAASASGMWSATSDAAGAYRLCVPAGEYVVQFVANGFDAQVSGVRVREAVTTPLYRRLGDAKPVIPNCSDVASAPTPVGCFP